MIIIPTYNERSTVGRLVERIRKIVGDIPILFVDDNSPDGTQQEIAALQLAYPNIQLLKRSQKAGLGSAYRQSFEQILRRPQAEFVVTMDADLSHDPSELPQILELIKHYPVVVGSRYTQGGKILRWNPMRRLISRVGNIYAKWLTGMLVSDLTSGYVAYRLDWLNQVPFQRMQSEGYAFQIEMKYFLHSLEAKIYEHPITFREREGGKSKFSTVVVLEGMWYPLKIFFERFFRQMHNIFSKLVT